MQSIYQLIKTHAARTPDAVAIAAPGRAPLTYSGLSQQVETTLSALNSMGVGQNQPVALVLPNGPEMAVAFLSVASGATSAPLNPAYGLNEFDFYLSDLNAGALIIQAGMDSPAREVAQARHIPIIELQPNLNAGAGTFTLAGASQTAPAKQGNPARPGDVALILHTSGTTSKPKMVPLTHANLCTSAGNIKTALALVPQDRCLNVMPLFHIHGLIGALLSSMAAGAGVACSPGFEAAKFFEWVDACAPTWYSAVPTIHQAVLEQSEFNAEIIQRRPLRLIRSSSAALPPRVMARLESTFNCPVIESYGMTEASHQMASNPLPPRPRKPGSVGVAAGPDIAIMDETGTLLPAGQTGEIVIRGANVTRGYRNNPLANRSAFTSGWFRTGDEGYLDADGYLFITGRIKEMINRGGEKITPRQIDEVLMEHPSVKQAVAFAVPHQTLGEDVAAAVVLRPGAPATEKELREFAFARLADFKVPSQILIVDTIPKGATGKLQRIGLSQKLGNRLRPQFAAPTNAVEETLAGLWGQVLRREQVGIYDNFFGLGGDSLQAARLVARIRAALQVELPLKSIFRGPTIAEQAVIVEELLLQEIEDLSDEEARQLIE